ncbi:hypothetical protein H0E87_025168 [Populus deltoides]|uniref:Uncharacterized protein n=1 Tax=Populus deltoides TaxID=3696 RepID=A0A8T2X8B2_POPDE|nr:hypothetical protein H0E87_025168 [Populus deltoides]
MENSSTRNYEARRAPSDCWAESNSKETNYDQRRESKWNTRWGPDDKDTDGLCEKWIDCGRDGDIPFGKDERENDHYRPWRSNSSRVRGRRESPSSPNSNSKQTGSNIFLQPRTWGKYFNVFTWSWKV